MTAGIMAAFEQVVTWASDSGDATSSIHSPLLKATVLQIHTTLIVNCKAHHTIYPTVASESFKTFSPQHSQLIVNQIFVSCSGACAADPSQRGWTGEYNHIHMHLALVLACLYYSLASIIPPLFLSFQSGSPLCPECSILTLRSLLGCQTHQHTTKRRGPEDTLADQF